MTVIILPMKKHFPLGAAMVFKASENHNFRVSYNRAANPIPASDIYFDLPIQREPGVLDIWNIGGKNPYTFGQNPQIDWLIPGVPNTNFSDGFPLSASYSFVNEDVIQQLEFLGAQDPQLAPLIPFSGQSIEKRQSFWFQFSFQYRCEWKSIIAARR